MIGELYIGLSALVLSVLLHELGHLIIAYYKGYKHTQIVFKIGHPLTGKGLFFATVFNDPIGDKDFKEILAWPVIIGGVFLLSVAYFFSSLLTVVFFLPYVMGCLPDLKKLARLK